MNFTPKEELSRRRARLQERIRQDSLDAALLAENMDLFYFAGSMQQGFLFVPAEGASIYMVKRNLSRAREESRLQMIYPLRNMKQLQTYIHDFQGKKKLERIGLELDVLPVNLFERMRELFPGTEFIDISVAIRETRMIKSAYEIDFFRQANEISLNVYEQIPTYLQAGKPEVVLSAEIENLYRRKGHQALLRMRAFNMEMFFCHVYSGENGAAGSFLDSCTGGRGVSVACPQSSGWRALGCHEPISIDYSSICGGYVLDHTRVFSIGALPPELEKAYRITVSIQDEVVSRARPGSSCRDLYLLAMEMAAGQGLQDYFMGHGEGQVKFIGHGLGLDIDEFPIFSERTAHFLQPGMVFALEPKFVFPGKGMVGIENVWLVTDSGLERLTTMPDDLVTVTVPGENNYLKSPSGA